LYACNIQFGARRSLLLYPRVSPVRGVHGSFVTAESPHQTVEHSCGMVFLDLFDGDKLRRDLGDEIIATLLAQS
jgi:hypothetical protein